TRERTHDAREDVRLGSAGAHGFGWCVLALVNAVLILLSPFERSLKHAVVHHFYDAGHMMALGLIGTAGMWLGTRCWAQSFRWRRAGWRARSGRPDSRRRSVQLCQSPGTSGFFAALALDCSRSCKCHGRGRRACCGHAGTPKAGLAVSARWPRAWRTEPSHLGAQLSRCSSVRGDRGRYSAGRRADGSPLAAAAHVTTGHGRELVGARCLVALYSGVV